MYCTVLPVPFCKISVLHCKISVMHCKISVLHCKISVLHCKISVLHCKMYCCSLLLLPLIEPVLDMHRSSQCFRNLQGYQVPRRDEASNTKLLHSFSLFFMEFQNCFFLFIFAKTKNPELNFQIAKEIVSLQPDDINFRYLKLWWNLLD